MTSDFNIEPAFVGDAYPAFVVHYRPSDRPKGHVIYLPPFAEEMNRCRATVAEQARRFARAGLSCSIVDFYGTGESFGELKDATIPIWHENICDVIAAFSQKTDEPLYLWGCRLGALVAVDYLSSHAVTCQKLLFWQPIVSGKIFVTQMLRQRVASLMERGEPRETTTDIRSRLAQGEDVEVAGYTLGGTLISQLDELDLTQTENLKTKEVFWLEHSMDSSGTPNPKSTDAITHFEKSGIVVHYQGFNGPPIWQLHERDTCTPLLDATQAAEL